LTTDKEWRCPPGTKDVTDLLSTTQVTSHTRSFVIYANTDYAAIRGLDLSWRIPWRYGGLQIEYTFSRATGNNSDPRGGYITAYGQEEVPHNAYDLDFDQRHDFVLNLQQRGWEEIWRPLGSLTCNLLFHAASGLPYTPWTDPGVRVPRNSARMPWRLNLDARLNYRFRVGTVAGSVFLQGTNLTDHENVLTVYPRTGRPFESNFHSGVGVTPDSDHNPAHVGAPPTLTLGMQWEL
jgi:hypothetical protein